MKPFIVGYFKSDSSTRSNCLSRHHEAELSLRERGALLTALPQSFLPLVPQSYQVPLWSNFYFNTNWPRSWVCWPSPRCADKSAGCGTFHVCSAAQGWASWLQVVAIPCPSCVCRFQLAPGFVNFLHASSNASPQPATSYPKAPHLTGGP